jgi:acetyl esterase/lipase
MKQTDDFPPLRVRERAIAVPRSISPEARAVLGRASENPITWPPYPAHGDTEAWLKYIEVANANMKAMIDALPEPGEAQVHVETLTVEGALCFKARGAPSNDVLFEIHGGALIGGGGELCRAMAARMSARFGATVYSPDYRMPPLHPYPTPLDDCLAAYRATLDQHAPERIVVHGGSAGGNLAAALMLRAREGGLPLPAGLILESPELDLTESGDSFGTNVVIDVVLQQGLGPANRLYANGHDLASPWLSPLFGDFSGGWPPTLLTAGTRDLFLSNAVRMLHRLREANVAAELLVYEAMPHGGFFGTPEDRRLGQDMRAFARRCWAASDGSHRLPLAPWP